MLRGHVSTQSKGLQLKKNTNKNKIKKTITCLNCTIISFESSMSLNIPSNLLVKAAPHSKSMTKRQSVLAQHWLNIGSHCSDG